MAPVAVVTYQSLACGRFSRISIPNKVLTPGETYSMRAERIVSDHLSNFWHLTSASSQSAKPLPVTARRSNRQIDSAGPGKGFHLPSRPASDPRNIVGSWEREGARHHGTTSHHPSPAT